MTWVSGLAALKSLTALLTTSSSSLLPPLWVHSVMPPAAEPEPLPDWEEQAASVAATAAAPPTARNERRVSS